MCETDGRLRRRFGHQHSPMDLGRERFARRLLADRFRRPTANYRSQAVSHRCTVHEDIAAQQAVIGTVMALAPFRDAGQVQCMSAGAHEKRCCAGEHVRSAWVLFFTVLCR